MTGESRLFLYIRVLSAVGIILALYLLWEQFFHPSIQPCNVNATINCNAIISGAVSKTFGLPTPLYGLIGYIVLFLGAIWERRKLVLSVATGGLLFCLSIGYIDLFQLHVICPVCIACEMIMLTIVILASIIYRAFLLNGERLERKRSKFRV